MDLLVLQSSVLQPLRLPDEDMAPMHMTMFGTWYGGVGGQQECPSQEGGPRLIWFVPEVEAQSNSSLSLSRVPGPVCLKLVTQDASGLHFRRSTYGWKANLIRKLIQVVSHQKTFIINRNRQNKSASRIYQGATTLSIGPLDRVSCLGPLGGASRISDDPKTFIIIRRRCR